jgi:hypothetical protein
LLAVDAKHLDQIQQMAGGLSGQTFSCGQVMVGCGTQMARPGWTP